MENYCENKYLEGWMENGVVFTVYKPELKIDLAIAKETVNLRKSIHNGITIPVFVDIRNLKSVTNEAREWLAQKEAQEFLSAVAIFTNTPIQNLFANFYLKLSKPPIPTQLFSDKEKAIRWLKLFLQQKINLKGVQIPVMKQVYEPVLEELKEFGIDFKEN